MLAQAAARRATAVGNGTVDTADFVRYNSCVVDAERRDSLHAQMLAVKGHIEGIQRFCQHPKDEQQHCEDYSGTPSTLCRVCGRDR